MKLLKEADGGQGWRQAAEFGLALLLSGVIGLEREIRQKSAGLRTYTTVGVGAGVIFVQRGSVQGLTTAATIWLTAAVGAAAGAGLPLLAVLATAAYFVVAYAIRPLAHRLPALRAAPVHYRIAYLQRTGCSTNCSKRASRVASSSPNCGSCRRTRWERHRFRMTNTLRKCTLPWSVAVTRARSPHDSQMCPALLPAAAAATGTSDRA
ncbi:MgtC/SapB family protein [Streptomyces sp. NPDC050418]|uniref:MgtC/SapB family protein n=1 Tax=Streptomyces sp. NPDC050418 TaxID=3365612 RepID=UPI00379920B9